ncbi:GSCOCG00008046001-RA-CDS [Cotesia congregata]|nr:GSCOCG00008046001-RA-CDS [Cotesia congregata]
MGKSCIVKSCPSGRKLKTTKNDPSQHLSFFQPSTPARLDKWQKCLGIKLKATNNICHLHFKEEHIKLYDKFIINGEVKIFQTVKKKLKPEALPTIEHQFIPIPLYELQASIINQRQKSTSCHNYCEDDQQDRMQNSCIEQQELLDDLNISNNATNYSQQIEQDLEKSLLSQQSYDSLNSHVENETTVKPIESIGDIQKCPMLPQFWMRVDKPDGLEFLRMDPSAKKTKNHIRLNEDLSLTVIFSNGEELSLDVKINSFKNICEFLKSVERWPLCVGTQIDSNKYSQVCKGVIISDDAYQRNQRNPRCKSCRILRKRLQSRKSTSIVLEKRNDHPDPKMFAQVYRLASCFSLVRPPKGSNVSGKDLIKSLIGAKEILTFYL